MIERLPVLDVTRLAADYSAAIRAAHSDLELKAIRDRNEAEQDPIIDHVHDFTDPTDLMHEAASLQLGRSFNWDEVSDEVKIAEARAKAAGFRLSRILIGCEFSGIVRDEMTARGHSATSCDMIETETPGNHYIGDVRDIIGDGYHLAIFHPPCTYLCASALWRGQPDKAGNWSKGRDPERAEKGEKALEFVRDLMAAPIAQWALEIPVGMVGSRIRPADQYVQPYQFGDDASKNTGLWLQDLPQLVADPADYVDPRLVEYKGKQVKRWANQTPCGADRSSPGPNRWKERSRTFRGIASAMADQWTGISNRLTAPIPAQQVGQLALF